MKLSKHLKKVAGKMIEGTEWDIELTKEKSRSVIRTLDDVVVIVSGPKESVYHFLRFYGGE